MARLQLNKSSLARETTRLKSYRRFLPSLDLKRRQLMAALADADKALLAAQQEAVALARNVGRDAPMLANEDIDLDDLARLREVRLDVENVVGVALPTLRDLDIDVRAYSALAKPHWVDDIVRLLREMIGLRVRIALAERRRALLQDAVRTITQRVNLFEKVLIPNAERNIKRIKIHLNEESMSAVVRSKIAKRKRAAA